MNEPLMEIGEVGISESGVGYKQYSECYEFSFVLENFHFFMSQKYYRCKHCSPCKMRLQFWCRKIRVTWQEKETNMKTVGKLGFKM